jgi:hypothetical protein
MAAVLMEPSVAKKEKTNRIAQIRINCICDKCHELECWGLWECFTGNQI